MILCSIEKCKRISYENNYCKMHYLQIFKFGSIQPEEIQPKERTIRTPNEFIIDGDICWIILYNRVCIEIARAKINVKYYRQIKESKLKWHLHNKGYAYTTWYDEDANQHQLFLHHAIIQLSRQIVQPEEEIDHKDGDKLNCLDDNLRICTPIQNKHNVKLRKDNSSGQKSVHLHKQTQKWEARIRYNGCREHLGLFNTIEDAARAYNAAATKYFGEFAVLNKM